MRCIGIRDTNALSFVILNLCIMDREPAKSSRWALTRFITMTSAITAIRPPLASALRPRPLAACLLHRRAGTSITIQKAYGGILQPRWKVLRRMRRPLFVNQARARMREVGRMTRYDNDANRQEASQITQIRGSRRLSAIDSGSLLYPASPLLASRSSPLPRAWSSLSKA